MATTTNRGFKAVDYMRSVRNDLSDLYQHDKEQFQKELNKAMADFLKTRKKTKTGISKDEPAK